MSTASSATNSTQQQQKRVKRSGDGSPTISPAGCSNCNTTTIRLQPIRATVPYQLLRGSQHSPTRSCSSSFTVASNTEPTSTSPCNSPSSPTQLLLANPGGNGSVEGRLVARQRRSPPDSKSSPERCPISPVFKGAVVPFVHHLLHPKRDRLAVVIASKLIGSDRGSLLDASASLARKHILFCPTFVCL